MAFTRTMSPRPSPEASIVHVAIPPSQGSLLGAVRAELLGAALSFRLRRRVVVTVADSYEQLAQLLDGGKHHALWVPPRLRERAERLAAAVLVPVRGASPQYCAALVAKPGTGTGLASLTGARAAWVAPTSSGGYRLAVEHLQRAGLEPGALFSKQTFYGSYRLALEAVLDGSADVTSIYATQADETAVRAALAEHVGEREVRLLPVAYTSWTASDVIVVLRSLPQKDAARLALAFMELSRDAVHDPSLRELLQAKGLTLQFPSTNELLAAAEAEARGPDETAQHTAFAELSEDGDTVRLHGPRGPQGSLESLLGAEGASAVRTLARRVAAASSGARIELRQALPDRVEWWTADAAPWNTTPPTVLVALRNVTAKRHGEADLLRMASFPVLDPSPVIELEADGNVKFANPAARALFPDLLEAGADHPIVRAAVEAHRTHAGEGAARVEYEHADRNLELRVSRIDELRSLRVFGMDVTERKSLEATLIRADRLVSLGTLCAGVGHEINNPLTYVQSNLEFVREEIERLSRDPASFDEGTDLRDALKDTLEGIRRISAIAGDLKTLSRGAADHTVPIDVRTVLESTLRMAACHLRGQVTVVRELSEVPPVDGNETRLGQVFLNLVMNAVHAMEARPGLHHQLTVRTRAEPDGGVVVEIADTGGGVPPELAPRLFEPFFTTKAAGSGTGLGLPISRAIVVGLGGTLSFSTEAGRGTTFRTVLPASRTAGLMRPAAAFDSRAST